jgi:hypothetical protein
LRHDHGLPQFTGKRQWRHPVLVCAVHACASSQQCASHRGILDVHRPDKRRGAEGEFPDGVGPFCKSRLNACQIVRLDGARQPVVILCRAGLRNTAPRQQRQQRK